MSTTLPWGRAAEPARRIGHVVEFHPAIGSTNDRARELLRAAGGDGEGVAVVADLQTAGRGRQGRSWLSPPGANLLVSVGLRPALSGRDGWWLGAVAALAACAACEAHDPSARLFVKWPNDLYTADGMKVGGILVEAELEADRVVSAVIGLGLNANWRRHTMPPDLVPTATSLADVTGCEVDRVSLLAGYLGALDEEVARLERSLSPIDRLRQLSWLDGRWVEVDAAGSRIEGRASGIADDGALLVETSSGTRSIAFGEVVHVSAAREAAA